MERKRESPRARARARAARRRDIGLLTRFPPVYTLWRFPPRSYIDLGIGGLSGFIWFLVFLGICSARTKCKGDDICMQCCSLMLLVIVTVFVSFSTAMGVTTADFCYGGPDENLRIVAESMGFSPHNVEALLFYTDCTGLMLSPIANSTQHVRRGLDGLNQTLRGATAAPHNCTGATLATLLKELPVTGATMRAIYPKVECERVQPLYARAVYDSVCGDVVDGLIELIVEVTVASVLLWFALMLFPCVNYQVKGAEADWIPSIEQRRRAALLNGEAPVDIAERPKVATSDFEMGTVTGEMIDYEIEDLKRQNGEVTSLESMRSWFRAKAKPDFEGAAAAADGEGGGVALRYAREAEAAVALTVPVGALVEVSEERPNGAGTACLHVVNWRLADDPLSGERCNAWATKSEFEEAEDPAIAESALTVVGEDGALEPAREETHEEKELRLWTRAKEAESDLHEARRERRQLEDKLKRQQEAIERLGRRLEASQAWSKRGAEANSDGLYGAELDKAKSEGEEKGSNMLVEAMKKRGIDTSKKKKKKKGKDRPES